MALELRSDRTYRLPAPPDAVWAELAALDRYRARWPWLRDFDAAALVEGDRWWGTLRAPLPYTVTFAVALTEVVPERVVAAEVTGDVSGRARIELVPDGGRTTTLRLVSTLTPRRPFLVALSSLARPVAVWGHDRVIERSLGALAEAVATGN